VLDELQRQLEDVEANGRYYRQRIEQLQTEPPDMVVAERERLGREEEANRLTGQAGRLEQLAAERSRVEAERTTLTTLARELEAAVAVSPGAYDEKRHVQVRKQIAALEPLVAQSGRLRAIAERAGDLVPRAAAADQELTRRETSARTLRESLAALGWSGESFERARAALKEAELAVRRAEVGRAHAAGELTAALALRAEIQRRREDRERRVVEAIKLRDELLLFQELDLELDEDYLATIIDEGSAKPVISGGEEDLANLALRLAISQMIAERAGQPLSLLVLDEIFGSLDEERRGSVLALLRQLADRFPQVILITHIDSVREGFDRVVRVSYDVAQGVSRVVDETPEPPPLLSRHAAA
jgi:exonuclease SbcC